MPRTQPARAVSNLFTKITFSKNTQAVSEQDNSQPNDGGTDKREEVNDVVTSDDSDDEKLQLGVKQMEAIASAWSIKVLVSAYIGIFLVFFLGSLQQQVTGSLTPYVTSAFSKHSLLSTTSIMSSIIGAVAKLPVAKIIDIWGRAEGYIMMVTLSTLGLIMMAACKNVETYAAAQVFYWIGYNGIVYVLDVFLADTSSLKNRGWLFAFSTSPYIATTFAGPAAADLFYKTAGWRWAFGAFSIIMPVVSIPVVFIFIRSRRKARKLGFLTKEPSGRTLWQSIVHYVTQFDVVGIFFVVGAFALILLAFNLAPYQPLQWKSPLFLSMIILGSGCLVAFGVWERYFAPVCFAPFHLLVDKMVLGSCLLTATLFLSFYCWDLYFLSYLQVVQNQNIRNAGYIANIFNLGGCIWAVVIGAFIRAYGRFKWVAFWFVPVQMIGVGLMIHFRQPGTQIGWIIMCQVFVALSGGTLQICEQVAIMAAASHSEIAVVLALLGLFSNIGGAIGQTIAGAIWTHTFPYYLDLYLPEAAKGQAANIYASLPVQLSYPMGSPERDAIIAAYAVGQKWMLVAGLATLTPAFVWVLMWRNIQLKDVKQVKGTVV